jgi:hypothetical protein
MKRQRGNHALLAHGAKWLLLIHQLPPKPAYLRVKIWRRLQALGAISVKGAVYVLPAREDTLEDLQWLLREIVEGGGEGAICEASLVDGLSDQEVRALFDNARDEDYAEIAKELRALSTSINGDATADSKPEANSKPEAKTQLARLRRRFTEVCEIDFFGSTGKLTADALLTELEKKLAEAPNDDKAKEGEVKAIPEELTGKIWVTRSGVHVDRIACAWLIRRFIDPQAQFKFVSAKDYKARSGELRFDMFQGEFTHEGDKCSFEVLLERLGLNDTALRTIGEIVHDIDLKDGKFGREETAGIALLINGVCASQKGDLARIERGAAIFGDTYESLRKGRGR